MKLSFFTPHRTKSGGNKETFAAAVGMCSPGKNYDDVCAENLKRTIQAMEIWICLHSSFQCERKEEYIERIQTLDFDTKAAIAAHIQEVPLIFVTNEGYCTYSRFHNQQRRSHDILFLLAKREKQFTVCNILGIWRQLTLIFNCRLPSCLPWATLCSFTFYWLTVLPMFTSWPTVRRTCWICSGWSPMRCTQMSWRL